MSSGEIRLNDRTTFELEILDDGVVVDVSTATTLEIIFLKPSGTVVIKTATHSDDGVDGKIKYKAEEEFLDEIGLWKHQGYVELSEGDDYHSDIHSFKVHRNLV